MAVNKSNFSSLSPAERELLKVREAAEVLGCCENTVRNLMRAGHLPFVRSGVSKGYRIDRHDLETYIGARKYRYAGPKPTSTKTQLKHLL